jgi:hypothetical protein
LKVKRVDYYYSRWTKSWKYRVGVAFYSFTLTVRWFTRCDRT